MTQSEQKLSTFKTPVHPGEMNHRKCCLILYKQGFPLTLLNFRDIVYNVQASESSSMKSV